MAAEADPTRTRDHRDVDISAFKTRGIYIDPSFKLDQIALKHVTRMVLVLPLVNGATALLELLPRPLLLFPRAPSIPRALVCAAPPHGHVVRRFRDNEDVDDTSAPPQVVAPARSQRAHCQALHSRQDGSGRYASSSRPKGGLARISPVSRTYLARKVGSPPPPRACAPSARRAPHARSPATLLPPPCHPLPLPCRTPAAPRGRVASQL